MGWGRDLLHALLVLAVGCCLGEPGKALFWAAVIFVGRRLGWVTSGGSDAGSASEPDGEGEGGADGDGDGCGDGCGGCGCD